MALKSNGVTQVPDGLGPPGKVLRVNSAGTAGEWGDPVISTKSDVEGLGIDVPATNLTGTIPAARLSTATTQAESDDSTKIATTAYVVDKITTLIGGAPSTLNDLNELAAAINDDANYNSTLTTALATKLPLAGGAITGNVTFGDNNKAIFGAGSDLEIYHNGTDSFIDEKTTGWLYIRGNNTVIGKYTGETYMKGIADGAVELYHNNVKKLETTAAGITVTGTVTSDGLTVDNASPILTLKNSDGTRITTLKNVGANTELSNSTGGNLRFRTNASELERMRISPDGDISFYEDTGTTAKFFWDASAEKLGIGTTPNNKLTLSDGSTSYTGHGGGTYLEVVRGSGADAGIILNKDTGQWMMGIDNSDGTNPPLRFEYSAGGSAHAGLGNGTVGLTLNYQGNVGIGTSSFGAIYDKLAVAGGINIQDDNAGKLEIGRYSSGIPNSYIKLGASSSSLRFTNNADSADLVTIENGGNVGIGTVSPQAPLDFGVTSTNQQVLLLRQNGNSRTGFGISNEYGVRVLAPHDVASSGSLFGVGKNNGTTYSGDLFTVQYGGNVGIGTTDPKANFQVIGPPTATVPAAGSGAVGGAIFSADLNTYGMFIGSINSGNGYIQQQRTNTATYYDLILQPNGGNVGIGTDSPDAPLVVQESAVSQNAQGNDFAVFKRNADGYLKIYSGNTNIGGIAFGDTNDPFIGALRYHHLTDHLDFYVNNSERMRIDSSGNVGIGCVPSLIQSGFDTLQIGGNLTLNVDSTGAGAGVYMGNNVYRDSTNSRWEYINTDEASQYLQANGTHIWRTAASGSANAAISWSERMRIDLSGNVLVGTTSAYGTSGTTINQAGLIYSSASGDRAGQFDRTTNDGELVRFSKAGTTVGSIGNNTDFYIASQDGCGLRFTNNQVLPCSESGATQTTSRDLGSSGARFRDLYLSNSIANPSGDLTLDASGDITLDADGGDVRFKDGGTHIGSLYNSSNNFAIYSAVNNADMLLQGQDGGTTITALRLDMSASGDAIFNSDVVMGSTGKLRSNGDDDSYLQFNQANTLRAVIGDSTRMIISTGETVFNEDSGDFDFRVESNNNTALIFVDASANSVRFGKTSGSNNDAGMMWNHNDYFGITTTSTDSGDRVLLLNRQGGNGDIVEFRTVNVKRGSISATTSGTTYNTTSDRRLKDNIEPISDATDKLMNMNPVTHTWIDNPDEPQVHGFIAQEMQEVVPEAVSGDAESDEMMSMDYGRITPVIVAALQDALKEIKELKTRIDELENN